MTDFEKQHSLELYVAGRDFPIHTTVGECVVPSGIALADAFGDVSNEESRSIVFSELVMQNGNILLTTSEATPWFDDFRNRVNASYEIIGFTPLPIEHLVHITLARIKQGSAEDIRALVETVCAIREDIKKEPIVAKVNRVFRGPSLSLLNKFPAQ